MLAPGLQLQRHVPLRALDLNNAVLLGLLVIGWFLVPYLFSFTQKWNLKWATVQDKKMIFCKVWRLAKINPGLLGTGELRVPTSTSSPNPHLESKCSQEGPSRCKFLVPTEDVSFPHHPSISLACLEGPSTSEEKALHFHTTWLEMKAR